jgi:septal ring factor EnvC (AmiA/AmiB activator)
MTHNNFGQSKNTLLLAMAFVVPSIAVADEQYEALKKQVELLQQQLEQVQSTLKQYQQETSASKLEVAELKTNVAQASVAASEWKKGFQSPGSPMAIPARGGNPSLGQADIVKVLAYLHEQFSK